MLYLRTAIEPCEGKLQANKTYSSVRRIAGARDPICIGEPISQTTEALSKSCVDAVNVILKPSPRRNNIHQILVRRQQIAANMFGAPPQPSKRELELAEAQTLADIKWTAASAVVLYFSPHLVEYVSKLF
ncbi:hypothetical protein T440DRAFT_504726 [Plenodomus tracheiphilus IPT5]|uniref:Uncharacterized protein n=1 Tax=Plenodomus tracheiphilus IPT5 TaxID=1408161 RepID=A0A6A7BIL9_9PLEO|nr:hypothetical protein T440DRAFT_504726 [Plenodomus tracheiphilus IPT5]